MTLISAGSDADVRSQLDTVDDGRRSLARAASLTRRTSPKAWLVVADGGTIGLAMLAAYALRASAGGDLEAARLAHLQIAVGSIPIWLTLFGRRRLYNVRFLTRRIDEVRRIGASAAFAIMTMTVAAYAFQLPVSRAWLVLTYVTSVMFLSVEREIVRRTFMGLRRRGRMLRRVVLVGSNDEALDVASMLESDPMLGYEVVGFVDDRDDPVDGRLLGSIAQTHAVVQRTGASSVIVCASASSVDTTNRLVRELLRDGIHVELSSTLRDIAAHRLTVRPLGRLPIVYVEQCEAGGWRAFAKRSFDIAGAGVAIVATAPVAAAIAVAVKLTSRGPAVYRQERVGKDGEIFEFRKFRSMVDGAHDHWIDLREQNEASGPIFKLKDDPRVTRVGRFLRKTSLDELPQLWNVLRGEMSLVGPRPALPEEMVMWEEQLHDRLRVRPGITGMWQVSGRSDADVAAYTRLDLYYVDNWSLFNDLIIILKTIPTVLFGKGAY